MAMVTSRVVDALIPVTMVGSYPRPRWYTRRSNGMDMREFWMDQSTREEYDDAVKAVLKDQELARLDTVSDHETFDNDLVGGAGWPEVLPAKGRAHLAFWSIQVAEWLEPPTPHHLPDGCVPALQE
jgi:hypothetical protein